METAQITQVKKQQIDSITIELDEWDSYNVKDHEIEYGEDYLEFDLSVYATVEHSKGDYFTPSCSEITMTTIVVDNLKMTHADGEVILLTDERKLEIEKEITNAIIVE